MTLTVLRPNGPWTILDPDVKLTLRAALPGAYGYDHAAHGVRRARARGATVRELLPLCLPTSWMVNNRTTSPMYRRWLTDGLDAWCALVERLDVGAAAWLEEDDDARDEVTALARALAINGQGACALSKVLALLCPQTVPLMDDAAIAFALGALPTPRDAENPTAGVEQLVPMLDWFAQSVMRNERDLTALARAHTAVTLDAAQCLDRLLWVDSWGWRALSTTEGDGARFWWLAAGTREGIGRVAGPHPALSPLGRIDLSSQPVDDAWRARAFAALHGEQKGAAGDV